MNGADLSTLDQLLQRIGGVIEDFVEEEGSVPVHNRQANGGADVRLVDEVRESHVPRLTDRPDAVGQRPRPPPSK